MEKSTVRKEEKSDLKFFVKQILLFSSLLLLYFITGKISLQFAFLNPSATPIWFPTGIALAAFLIYGNKMWPAVFLGALLVNYTTAGNILTSLLIATGNTLEGLIGAYLINIFANGKKVFFSLRDIIKFIFIVILITTLSANIGVFTLIIGGLATWSNFLQLWITWWLGDLAGALMVTPFILFWLADHSLRSRERPVEALFILFALLSMGLFIFGGFVDSIVKQYPFEFLLIPIIPWVVFRFGRRETMSAIAVLSMLAISGTVKGYGPFTIGTPDESLLVLQIFMSVVTITALVLAVAVAERRKAEERLKYTLDSMIEGFQVVDFDWRYVYLNDPVVKQAKSTKEKLLGQTMMEAFPGIEKTEMFKRLKECMKNRTAHRMENRFDYPDGTSRWFQLRIEPVVEGLLILSIDITPEKEAEKMKTEFIYLASHELRTPLSVIKGFTSMINSGNYGVVSAKLKRPFELIAESTDRLVGRVNDILNISKIEADRLNFKSGRYSLDSLLNEVINDLKPVVKEAHKKIVLDKHEKIYVSVDKTVALEVIKKVIASAINFVDKKVINVSVKKQGRLAVVFINDSGVEIKKENSEEFFSKIEFLKSRPRGESPGVGLGLYIAKEFTRKMGGDVWFENNGNTFVFSLPIASK